MAPPPHPEVLACGDGVKCMPPMVVATDAGRNSLAPKVPRVGRLLRHAIIHIPGKKKKSTEAKRLCLVRFGPSLGVGTPDCFVALKSVERCTDSVELLPAAVEWGNELELVVAGRGTPARGPDSGLGRAVKRVKMILEEGERGGKPLEN